MVEIGIFKENIIGTNVPIYVLRRKDGKKLRCLWEIPCPICGEIMSADIHAPQDGSEMKFYKREFAYEALKKPVEEWRMMDVWLCVHCFDSGRSAVFDRDDEYIKEWIKNSKS